MDVDSAFKQANADLRAGRFGDAEKRYRALTRVKPQWAWHNLGTLYMQVGRDKESETALRTALRLGPNFPPPRYTLGLQLMRQGRYREGWPFYESRRDIPELNIKVPSLSYPEWQGEDLAGKHLVVVRDQGFGDQIMFARVLPELAARAAKVSFVCSPNLIRLFEGLGAELIPASEAEPPAVADHWSFVCSLGGRLGLTPETLPAAPYLTAGAPSTGGGVGVVVKGSATHKNDRNRSLPEDLAAQLLALGRDLSPEATGARDFRETAEIIAGLDVVVSVDTSVAHLAGALGKPVWILVPAVDTDWRWMRGRADSPWYPSARLYRQPGPGKWAQVVQTVVRDLQAAGWAKA